ncbi:hypothetical protein LCGC14_3025160 [marine sediment metagenome]|uniref:Uncharacterized protein n=1 Tax=marine sediment metagenome TaxID=412755 RepID=A0A0F8ZKA9_9ZZZZ
MRKYLGILGLSILLVACGQDDPPRFKVGERVKSVLTGDMGMVNIVWLRKYPYCRYSVRFPALQLSTNTRTFGSDDPITLSPLTTVDCMGEWELEPVMGAEG